MTRIADFFGVPQPLTHPYRECVRENQGVILEEDPTINQVQQNQRNASQENMLNQGGIVEVARVVNVKPFRQVPQILRQPEPRVMLVNRNQNADEVLYKVRRDNVAAMVKRIMA